MLRIPRVFDHEEWICKVEQEAAGLVRKRLPDGSVLEVLAHRNGGSGVAWLQAMAGVRNRIPDLLFMHGSETVVVEVGQLGSKGRGKWPELPMVHLNFDGSVEVVSSEPSTLAALVAEAIREVMSVP